MTIEGTSPLYQALRAAFDANDAEAFNKLIRQRLNDILAEFSSWQKVPVAISADEAAASQYIQCLIAIAQAADALGEPALVEKLIGPIGQWKRRLSHAQALSNAGEYTESNSQLEKVLAEMEGATGNAVVNLRPRILGRLGFNALHEQDYATSLDYMTQAYAASMDAKDEEGIVVYYENLMCLRIVQVLDTEPERGRSLLDLRRRIVQAQDLTDTGRYQASNNLLSEALSFTKSQNNDEMFRALLPKIHGLMGFNEYKLGNVTKAHEHTALALEEAETLGDIEGVRIYAANLETISESGS